MRPDACEMRADMEEQEVEPSEVFVDLGMLIVEGRVPGLTERGFGEGPHCPSAHPGPHSKHECDPQVLQCQRQENFCKHMLLLYKNNIPMSVEVLLCPDCCYGKDTSSSRVTGATAAIPEPSYVLLEQWTLQMISKRIPEVSLTARGLLQAVRSYLHFSQLSAWYSLSKGKAPKNVMYRICVPGETFSNKFNQIPNEHTFPLACAGKQNCMKISVRSLPRSNHIPDVICREHSLTSSSVNMKKLSLGFSNNVVENFKALSMSSSNSSDKLVRNKKPRETIAQRMFAFQNQPSRTLNLCENSDKPSDPMLGDSLLDPPQSLQMYHKRYQSPSRSGSPSLEAPEHLLSCTQKSSRRYNKSLAVTNFHESEPKSCQECGHTSRPRLKKNLVPEDKVYIRDKLNQSYSNAKVNKFMCSNHACSPATVGYDPRWNARDAHLIWQALNKHYEKQKLLPSYQAQNFAPNNHGCPSSDNTNFNKWNCLKEYKERLNQESEHFSNLEFQHKKPLSKLVTSEKPFYSEFSCDRIPTSCRTKVEESVKYIYHPSKSDPETRHVSVQTDQSQLNDSTTHNSLTSLPHSKTWSNGLCHLPSNISDCSDELLNCILSESEVEHKESASESKLTNFNNGLDHNGHSIPSENQKAIFRRSLDSATSMVFHNRTSLPLTSSPAPIRKGRCFDFDSTLTSVHAIKRALFDKDNSEEFQRYKTRIFSTSAPASTTTNSLLGNFEESVLNGRLEPVSTVEGFTAEIGASGCFCPNHITVPVTVFFYTLQDNHKVTSPYLGHVNLGKKGYHVPKKGTIQVTLFNPHRTVVKMFVVMYDFMDMPPNSQTFLRQRILYMPSTANEDDEDSQSWLRYLLHLRFCRSKSGKIYLHTDLRMVIFRKSDMDAATIHENKNSVSYELRSFTHGPTNPKFSPIK